MKVGAVRDQKTERIGVVFEFTKEELADVVAVVPVRYKRILSDVFHKEVNPRHVIKALSMAVKAIRRKTR